MYGILSDDRTPCFPATREQVETARREEAVCLTLLAVRGGTQAILDYLGKEMLAAEAAEVTWPCASILCG